MFTNFNPHSHAGSDERDDVNIYTPRISIHTPTQGVTVGYYERQKVYAISIHTPTQGVTISIRPPFNDSCISIHTPTQGVTEIYLCVGNRTADFNPHSHAGSDDAG